MKQVLRAIRWTVVYALVRLTLLIVPNDDEGLAFVKAIADWAKSSLERERCCCWVLMADGHKIQCNLMAGHRNKHSYEA